MEKLEICPVENSGGKLVKMGMGFQVADVRKPLVAVKRISEKGNLVQFGLQKEDNFIQNKQTRDKIFLREQGNSYIMDVQFENGEWTEITVDSAAEESVCPKSWGQQFGILPAERKLRLVNASGGNIEHHGRREVTIQATLCPF